MFVPAYGGTPNLASLLTGKYLLAYHGAMSDVFKALADPTRRAILDELSERDGQTLFELCGRLASRHNLAMSRQAVSQHLDVLEQAGLVQSRREGRYKYLSINTGPLEAVFDRWTKRPTSSPESRPGKDGTS